MELFKTLINWLINNLLKVTYFFPRNKNIWLFGAWGGDFYSDNSKYFFEYVLKHHPEINAIWITKSKRIKKDLQNKNIKCFMFNEPKAIKYRLRAKLVFFTNGIFDIGNFDLSHGAVKVALWHGMPLKKLCFATNNLQKRNISLIRYIQYIYLRIYDHTHRNITIATSEKSKYFLKECFQLKDDSVFITGQPRNDALFDEEIRKETRAYLNHSENDRLLLYMPTWRNRLKNDNFLDNILKELLDDSSFMASLQKFGIKLYIKPHPRIIMKNNGNENIILLNNDLNIDTQALLATADVLITDYSSVFIDFALTNRPVHFFVPDIEKYSKDRLGLFLSFEEFSEFWFEDLQIFKRCICETDFFQEKGVANSLKINEVYNDPLLQKGQYSFNLVKKLKEERLMMN